MSATKHHSSPITGTGKVLSLRTDTAVPVRMVEKLLDSETRSVIPFATPKRAGVDRVHSAPPATDRPSTDVLTLAHGRGNISLDKASEAAIIGLLDAVRTANGQAACVWLRAGDYNMLEGLYGHQVGLEFMELVEARLSGCLREGDLVCPVGSNEFVVVLKDVENNDVAAAIAERLLVRGSGVYQADGFGLHVQCSAGVALYPVDAAEPYQLLRYARMALPEFNPKQPTQCRFFSTELLARLHDRAWMTAELERAVEQDRLVLHYQPQYAIDTQRVVAVEALVRLETESGELIGPNDFIELAEETGQILQLGRWVIEEACQQLGHWQQAGLGMLRMAVNVSPCQLIANDFCAVVDAAVASAGIRHSDLELEITECQLVENLPYVERTLRLLAAKGVRVAVDDFGTGYSSLAYLMQLSISTVKVDRVFVSPIAEDARAGRIVKLIIAMAQELGLGLTAEGIETEAQHRFLLDSGCQLGQGYGFARPQSAEAIERFLF
ncbi:MAG: putative bifunctional diguanylate cyclase/phosphodiesterase [Thiogranum sp.]